MTQQIKNGQEDFVAFADRMRKHGWYDVELSRYIDNHHAIDTREWVRDNCAGKYNSFGCHWIFERSEDAVMFKLKWS
jgi:hypothetical protein